MHHVWRNDRYGVKILPVLYYLVSSAVPNSNWPNHIILTDSNDNELVLCQLVWYRKGTASVLHLNQSITLMCLIIPYL